MLTVVGRFFVQDHFRLESVKNYGTLNLTLLFVS
jgi:hypothetical protein